MLFRFLSCHSDPMQYNAMTVLIVGRLDLVGGVYVIDMIAFGLDVMAIVGFVMARVFMVSWSQLVFIVLTGSS